MQFVSVAVLPRTLKYYNSIFKFAILSSYIPRLLLFLMRLTTLHGTADIHLTFSYQIPVVLLMFLMSGFLFGGSSVNYDQYVSHQAIHSGCALVLCDTIGVFVSAE